MSLRGKTVLILVALFSAYALLSSFMNQLLLLPSFVALERNSAEKDVERCKLALENEIKHLGRFCADWSAWDDTYTFVHDRNEAYVASNLVESAFLLGQVNTMCYYNAQGVLVWGGTVEDLSAETPPISRDSALCRLQPEDPLLQHTSVDDSINGVLLTGNQALLVTSQPIIQSSREGPIAGSLIMARNLSAGVVESLVEQTRVEHEITLLTATTLTTEQQAAIALLVAGAPYSYDPSDQQHAHSYELVNDIYGQPALLITVNVAREITAHGKSVVSLMTRVALAALALVVLLTMLILERMVLSRIAGLSRFVRTISVGDELSKPFIVNSNDELGHLGNEINGMIGTLYQRTRQLDLALHEAQAATRAKSEFLAQMSHEIRTPLNGIIGMLWVLQGTAMDKEQREYANVVQNSAEALLTIVNDILDYSKVEAGKLELELIPFDLRSVIEGSLEVVAPRAQQKGIEMLSIVNPSAPRGLLGDAGRLRQILVNLLGNAVKFTEQGEVVLSVDCLELDDTSVKLAFAVHDTGIGIPKSKQSALFESFSQVDSSTTRKYGGTGLGLAICRQLVTLMGGEIGLESEVGQGSLFWFQIRFKLQEQREAIEPMTPEALRGLRVLVVDDNDTNRQILLQMLSSWGYVATEAKSAAEAMHELEAALQRGEPYQLGLLDFHMPEVNGEQLARHINANPELAGMPLILLTSIGEKGDARRMRAAGFAGYLLKPVKTSLLFDCIATVMGAQDVSITAEPELVTQHSLAEAHRGKVHLLLAEDNPTNQQVALNMLRSQGFIVDVACNGLIALQMFKEQRYDAVLMDCNMPEMSGYEATEAIRKLDSPYANTPIIAMTASAMEGDRERCLAAGMNDYISKPVNPKLLFSTISQHIPGAASLGAGLAPAEKAAAEPLRTAVLEQSAALATQREASTSGMKEPHPPIDIKASIERAGDHDFWCLLITTYLDEVSQRLEALDQTFAAHDIAVFEREAHSIKGSSGEVLAQRMCELAYQLELQAKAGDISSAPPLIAALRAEFEALKIQLNDSGMWTRIVEA